MRQRPFLHKAQWVNPWEGLSQTIVGRIYSNALWIPLYDMSLTTVYSNMGVGAWQSWVAGMGAGALNSVLTHPLAAIKYQMWNSGHSFERTAKAMIGDGARNFMRGSMATVKRDIIFGGVSAVTQHKLAKLIIMANAPSSVDNVNPKHEVKPLVFGLGTVAGALASSPFNYERNRAFQTPLGRSPPGTMECFRTLWKEMQAAFLTKGVLGSWNHLSNQMRWGWGTMRVGLGMGIGAWVYHSLAEATEKVFLATEEDT
mmetsp:Transcript_3945/g.6266  ORF Transcript_3945/g.6266 Transcript_3945/m.6266 type:complete len:257 (-) Transcript_3945:780-1550(-)